MCYARVTRMSNTLSEMTIDAFDIEAHIADARVALLDHPVYRALTRIDNLRVFMTNHVFAVWDFMTLLKELQRRLTCVETPWLPPSNGLAARIINEIVLCEESDEIRPGEYSGHFDLYLSAMQEVGADSLPIRSFISALRRGEPPAHALASTPIVPATRRFVLDTLAFRQRGTHEVAAAFLFGREHVIPDMFSNMLETLDRTGVECSAFRTYLNRHIEVDGDTHGPLARRLLQALCRGDRALTHEATCAAQTALASRTALWDAVFAALPTPPSHPRIGAQQQH
jgi:hypothetical protein